MKRKPGPMDPFLARALSALEEMEGKPVQVGVRTLPLSALVPKPQVRRRFAAIEELAASIREKGVLQPLLVRPLGEGKYAIIAGERRYRAAGLAGLSEVPVRVVEVSEKEAKLLALLENLAREDLNPYEETLGVLDLLSEDLGKPREEVVALLRRMRKEARGEVGQNVLASLEAKRVEEFFRLLGRFSWESFVQARLPLLFLPEDLKEALEEGAIPYTAALELKKVKEEALRKALLEEAKAGLSLRELKARVRETLKRESPERPWYEGVLEALRKTDIGALPAEKRSRVEALLAELRELLVNRG